MKQVRLFTIAFGERYLDWFRDACVRSLCWPRNRAALIERVAAWDIWTTEADAQMARDIASSLGVPVEIHTGVTRDRTTLVGALIGEMQLCCETGAGFLFAAPDTVFGDGSARSFLEIGAAPGTCIAAVPMRVASEGFIEAMGEGPLSNAQLVRLGMERMHASVKHSNAALPQTNSRTSGLSWRRIDEHLYAVTYRLPSTYLMQPNAHDVKWFRERPKFGNYDHGFPRTLVEKERQRVIGSSDAAFIAELTPADVANVPLFDTDPKEPDKYVPEGKYLLHHAVNRNVAVIWRSE